MVANVKTSILARVVKPELADLSPDAAQTILSWQFNDQDRQRVSELLAKNNANTITREERGDLDTYTVLGDLLSVLHAKAHLSLQNSSNSLQKT